MKRFSSSSGTGTAKKHQRSKKVTPILRPGLLLTDLSDTNLKLAAQCGATDIVGPCPGFSPDALESLVQRIESFGLRLSVIERFVPHDKIVHDLPGRDEQVENIKTLIRTMGKLNIKCLCYNWMPSDDWTRTAVNVPVRGGALATAFDLDYAPVEVSGHKTTKSITSRVKLWDTLNRFLQEIIPVCEEANVNLALHPDDPPLETLHGQPQICYSVEQLKRVTQLVPSKCNGVCFCQGTFASAGEDIATGIRLLGTSIKFIHFRNVICENPGTKFQETWQDLGDIDNVLAIRTYMEVLSQESTVIRPDHVPTLETEDNSNPGYHVLGRIWALGYMKGLIESTEKSSTFSTKI
jgi:mannonate dehydratase